MIFVCSFDFNINTDLVSVIKCKNKIYVRLYCGVRKISVKYKATSIGIDSCLITLNELCSGVSHSNYLT